MIEKLLIVRLLELSMTAGVLGRDIGRLPVVVKAFCISMLFDTDFAVGPLVVLKRKSDGGIGVVRGGSPTYFLLGE